MGIGKIRFIHIHIFIAFNQNFDEKFYISAKLDVVKHSPAVFLLTAKQRRRPIGL